jgi:hypothetical protein
MRGRPKNIENLPNNIIPKRQFTREYKNSDGGFDIWTYNLDKFTNGPISVETIYAKNNTISTPSPINDSKLSLSQRKWINPSNGKEVSYQRARVLGLINPSNGK